MIKLITIIVLIYVMTGCASTSPNAQAKHTLKTAKGYKVRGVNVTFAEHVFYDFSEEHKHYPNEEELAIFFRQDIEKYLKQNEKSCQSTHACLTLDVDIKYQRNFNNASVSSSAPIIDRTITIHKGNTNVYSNTQMRLKPYKEGILGKSFDELAKFTNAGESKANIEDEREYIDIISQETVKDIIQLTR